MLCLITSSARSQSACAHGTQRVGHECPPWFWPDATPKLVAMRAIARWPAHAAKLLVLFFVAGYLRTLLFARDQGGGPRRRTLLFVRDHRRFHSDVVLDSGLFQLALLFTLGLQALFLFSSLLFLAFVEHGTSSHLAHLTWVCIFCNGNRPLPIKEQNSAPECHFPSGCALNAVLRRATVLKTVYASEGARPSVTPLSGQGAIQACLPALKAAPFPVATLM